MKRTDDADTISWYSFVLSATVDIKWPSELVFYSNNQVVFPGLDKGMWIIV